MKIIDLMTTINFQDHEWRLDTVEKQVLDAFYKEGLAQGLSKRKAKRYAALGVVKLKVKLENMAKKALTDLDTEIE